VSADGDAVTGRHDLGIFARTFPRSSADEVATAVSAAGYGLVQLNLSAVGLPTLPAPAEHGQLDFGPVRQAFDERGIGIWGLSASYNMIHPDPVIRAAQTEAAVALIGRAPELGATAVTLCTGSRDPDNMWRRDPGNDEPAAWDDLRATLDRLLPAAAAAGVRLGIEPEPGNVVADTARARRLLDELGGDAGLTGIILDPANLVTVATAGQQDLILAEAASLLAGSIVQDAAEDDVARVRDFLLAQAEAAGAGGLRVPEPRP
jgi:sugar phosphate isomerase/epimerase